MSWQTAIYFGALGGALVEVINIYGLMTSWQAARHRSRSKKKALPPLSDYIDPLADVLVAFTRLGLGAVAGWAFHQQIVGTSAAIAVGASAPALLRQLGTQRTVRDAVQGEGQPDGDEENKPETDSAGAGPIPSGSPAAESIENGNQQQQQPQEEAID